jgi:dsDNA-specific endonuclease/ATPase MutS2
MPNEPDPIELPINGILDLHHFQPSDLGSLIPEYIEACLEKEIHSLRIIHGKGTGALRRGVHALLDRNPHVVSYGLATDKSSWGATLVEIMGKSHSKSSS